MLKVFFNKKKHDLRRPADDDVIILASSLPLLYMIPRLSVEPDLHVMPEISKNNRIRTRRDTQQ